MTLQAERTTPELTKSESGHFIITDQDDLLVHEFESGVTVQTYSGSIIINGLSGIWDAHVVDAALHQPTRPIRTEPLPPNAKATLPVYERPLSEGITEYTRDEASMQIQCETGYEASLHFDITKALRKTYAQRAVSEAKLRSFKVPSSPGKSQ